MGDPFPEQHKFAKGMKLEAIDPQHQSLICVVSVIEVQGPRLRLHFDGYGDSYDFWENADSENLFPAGWCSRNKQRLVPPKGKFLEFNFYFLLMSHFQVTHLTTLHGTHICRLLMLRQRLKISFLVGHKHLLAQIQLFMDGRQVRF